MDIKQLESVYWVHKLGSFSAAAQYLNTTQPNISGRIQSLERELGTTVFERSHRRVKLTAAGHAILREAERIIDAIRELKRFAAGHVGMHGTVRLGMMNTVAQTWMPALFQRLIERHEQIDIDFSVDTSAVLRHQFDEYEIDLLISTEQLSGSDIVSRFLYSTGVDWVANKTLRFPRASLTASDLLPHRLITYPRGTLLHAHVMDFFKPTGAVPARISTSNSLTAMMQLVASGIGLCTMPGVALHSRYADTLTVLNVTPQLPQLDFYVTYRHDPMNELPPLIAETALEICAGFAARQPAK